MDNEKVFIYDSTLREGSQKTGIGFSVEDKLRILERMAQDLEIPMIEAGWPGSNPKDLELFDKLKDMDLGNTKIYAFSSTRRKNTCAEDDPNIQALLNANIEGATLF